MKISYYYLSLRYFIMQGRRYIHISVFFLMGLFIQASLYAQLGFDLDIKKPAPYENREVKAEKTGQKKFNLPRRFFQDLTTHYNYFFNANSKLNEIIARAKDTHRDDYTLLLPFYNYSLETTAADSALLDSVIYKSKTGIVLHDLRNDWVDDLYLLWGASYYLKQQYDSAYQMFQFINYSFADKEKDGYYKFIGSRLDGSTTTSIASKEDLKFPKGLIADPPGRNNALVWQVRTLIQQGALPEAASLISALKNDPVFPKRLFGALEEVQALWFYKQAMWDSAAIHLANALGETKTKGERARWEYLIAQLFERKDKWEEAKNYYSKAILHTVDPVMDIYARLNLIRINKAGGDDYINRNIAELVKMARKDKFEEYRDVIYSMAAQMELERGNFATAQYYLIKASQFKTEGAGTGNTAYLKLADLTFEQKNYLQAASFYDSVKIDNLPTIDAERITKRKAELGPLVSYSNTVTRQDSLQKIAALPEEERTALIKKKVKQLRKQQGLKEDETAAPVLPISTSFVDPFAGGGAKGEWYFYNKNLKTNGVNSFKQVWANRPNVDNWRRFSNVTAQLRNNIITNTRENAPVTTVESGPPTIDLLTRQLPLTAEQLKSSNDSIQYALLALGNIYVNELEDYAAAIKTYEQLLDRFDQPDSLDRILFQLYYSYSKTGNNAKANEIKKALTDQFPANRYTSIVNNGIDPQSVKPVAEITRAYEGVYDLYLEGRFTEAQEIKKRADSLYGTNYWTPQLLYIEAVYHIKQNEDSLAKAVLTTLAQRNAGTPLGAKAENLMQVLSRRRQIEEELTNLQIERPQEDSLFVEPMPIAAPVQRNDTVAIVKKETPKVTAPVISKTVGDSVLKKPIPPPQKEASLYTFSADAPHYAVVILNKVDVVFGNEAKNAFVRYNRERYYSQPLESKLAPLNDELKLLLIGNFSNAQGAIDYVQKAKPIAGSQIVPWLKGDKYTFSIITEANLQALLGTKDLGGYLKFLEQNLPVKF